MSVQKRLDEANTFKGQYMNILGFVFSIYCVYKVIMSTVNIAFNRTGGSDPVTYSITLLIELVGWRSIDVELWSQQLSFALIGVMIFATIRGLLIQLMKVGLAVSAFPSSGSQSSGRNSSFFNSFRPYRFHMSLWFFSLPRLWACTLSARF